MTTNLSIFENYQIRRIYDEETETWFFSVIDIIQALIQQPDYQLARNYWKVLKNRLKKEGSELVTKCNRLELEEDEPVTECHQLKMKKGDSVTIFHRLKLDCAFLRRTTALARCKNPSTKTNR